MKVRAILIVISFIFLTPKKSLSSDLVKICKNFYFTESAKGNLLSLGGLKLSDNEEILICGGNAPGWKNIPDSQAIANLTNFLRVRGYYYPDIKNVENKIIIEPGTVSRIKKLKFFNMPKNFKDTKFLGVKDGVLNTESLDLIKSWAISRLRAMGYPCPEAELKAYADSGLIEVTLTPGVETVVNKILRDDSPLFKTEVLSRYNAFQKGKKYNGDLFALTSRRLQTTGIIDYSSFDNLCEQNVGDHDGFFKQRLGFSDPRSVIFAVGASTEQYPILKASWKNSLVDSRASSVEASVFASSIEQSVRFKSFLYFFEDIPRLFFNPEVKIARIRERVYESFDQNYGVGLGYSHDDNKRTYTVNTKPTYNFEDRIESLGSNHIKYFSIENTLSVFSHDYEFYRLTPRSGYQIGLDWFARRDGLGSNISNDYLNLKGTFLINWGGFDPPLFVFGLRFRLASLKTTDLEDAPNKYKLFLGGDRDLRGFSRNSINNGDLGFKSLGYVGTELRLMKVMPYKLQPLVFLDYARVGMESSLKFDPGYLWSVGLGLRWQSPIGAFRGTVGKGLSSEEFNLEEKFTAFFSLGQEF